MMCMAQRQTGRQELRAREREKCVCVCVGGGGGGVREGVSDWQPVHDFHALTIYE